MPNTDMSTEKDIKVQFESGMSLDLMRKQLGSVTIEDLEHEEMDESERKQYCASISAVFPRLEKDMKVLLHAQMMYIGTQAGNMEEVIFGRGTFNGIDLLLEMWKKAHLEHTNKEPKEEFDETSPLGEV